MRVFNNMAAMAALNENDRNLKKANKSLAQAAQSMLAQANQTPQSVISLLQ